MPFLPMSIEEVQQRGWDSLDIIIVSGDAYVDHPSFGAAIIGRSLEAAGFKVGIIAQPDWQNDEDFLALGRPRLFFGVTAGNMDSMVNHYTAQRKIRHNDAYTPDGVSGKRPDRATFIYTNQLRKLHKGVPVVIGGIEASLRRIAHYDFWSDKVRNSILADTKADMLVYGMAEKAIVQIAQALDSGQDIKQLVDIKGTMVYANTELPMDAIELPEGGLCADKDTFFAMSKLFDEHHRTRVLYQVNGGRLLQHNPPADPLSTEEMDALYALKFMNLPHSKYDGHEIPAFTQIKDSITAHRGCFGGCNFCAIGCHQGRVIQSRSQESIVTEAKKMAISKTFRGTMTDIGGPTANMYGMSCKLGYPDTCKRNSCLFPTICSNLDTDHKKHLAVLNRVRYISGIRNVFISSGIRHDLVMRDPDYILALAMHFTGGRLKLAPEHVINKVLSYMGKPSVETYEKFCAMFNKTAKEFGKKQQIIPYLLIGHPGTTLNDAIDLGLWLVENHIQVEQVQEFTPTPMTISTCMYYTGKDFATGKQIDVPKGHQIRLQKGLALWHDSYFEGTIMEALTLAGRKNLIRDFTTKRH
jgi:uncharacterized radical SAM protein YgiQ